MDRDPARARVADGVGQRLLRDAENLALGAAENAGSSPIVSSIGTSVPRRASSDHALERRRRRLRPCSCGRSAPTDRRASTMCVRARSTAVSMLRATGGGQRRRRSLRRPAAASGSRRSPARACRGCRARAGCALRAPPGGALRAALLGELALMQRERRLPGHRVEQRAMPGARRSRSLARTTARTIRGSASAAPAARRGPTRCRSTR